MFSKSKIKQGLNCEKALFLSVHKKFLAKYSATSQAAFKRGTDVGDFARTYFPDGVLIPGVRKEDKLSRTKKALEMDVKLPLFEASFDYEDILAQVDILNPQENNLWKVIEVKSGTSVKEDYLIDLAIQVVVLTSQTNTPLNFSTFNFWLVDKESLSKESLFKEVDVTKEVKELAEKIKPTILELIKKIKSKVEPTTPVGSQCFYPYECPFIDNCWKKTVEEQKTVLVLPWDQREKFLKQKKLYLRDTDLSLDVIEALEKKEVYFKEEEIKDALKEYDSENLVYLRIYTRMNTYPEKEFGPYSKIPWGFSLLQGETKEEFLFTGEVSKDTVWKILKPLINYKKVVVFDSNYEIYKLADLISDEIEKQSFLSSVVNLYSVCNRRLYFPYKTNYSLQDFISYFLKNKIEEVSTLSFENIKETKEVLEKIQLTSNLREQMKTEAKELQNLFVRLKGS